MALIIASLVFGCELALIALSFSLSFRVIGFANFAHGELVTIGACAAFGFASLMPLPIAMGMGAVTAGLVGVCLDLAVFRRLEHAEIPTKMIASAGIAIAFRAILQFLWGVNPRMFNRSLVVLSIGGARISVIQVVVVTVTVTCVVLFHLILTRTHFGRCLRATADNRSLVEIRGVNSRRIVSLAWFISGTIAGLGGVLLGMETFVRPSLGQTVLLPMFAAALVGGFGSPYGAIAGALLLSVGQTALVSIDFGSMLGGASFFLGSHYKSVFAFSALVVILLLRPGGLFGEKRARA